MRNGDRERKTKEIKIERDKRLTCWMCQKVGKENDR